MLKLLSEFYVGNNKYCIVQVGKNNNVSVMPLKKSISQFGENTIITNGKIRKQRRK